MDEQQPLQLENADVKNSEQEPDQEQKQETEVEALSNNKVDVEIEPDVKSNNVVIQICTCSFHLAFNCFSAK
jgi:hypothetical protein